MSWIKAIGHTIQTNSSGTQLTVAFDEMEARLSRVYGQHLRTDFLVSGSIWDEPRDVMQGFLNQERYLFTKWTAEHSSTLKDSIASVFLTVTALDNENGYLVLEYSFENGEEADADLHAEEDEVL